MVWHQLCLWKSDQFLWLSDRKHHTCLLGSNQRHLNSVTASITPASFKDIFSSSHISKASASLYELFAHFLLPKLWRLWKSLEGKPPSCPASHLGYLLSTNLFLKDPSEFLAPNKGIRNISPLVLVVTRWSRSTSFCFRCGDTQWLVSSTSCSFTQIREPGSPFPVCHSCLYQWLSEQSSSD